MPFTDDCRDRKFIDFVPGSHPRPLQEQASTDGAGLAERLQEIGAELGTDELHVLTLVAERFRLGRQRYGALHVKHDPRCFRVEALEEAIDGFVYAAVALMQRKGTEGL